MSTYAVSGDSQKPYEISKKGTITYFLHLGKPKLRRSNNRQRLKTLVFWFYHSQLNDSGGFWAIGIP